MKKAKRGNPWHDERGRFCSANKAKIKTTREEYDEETERLEQVAFSFKGEKCHAKVVDSLPDTGVNGCPEVGVYELGGKKYSVYRGESQSGTIAYYAVPKDYRISHRPQGIVDAENGEADFATDISRVCMPGYYEHPEYYPSYHDERVDKETYEVLKRIKDNPEAEVRVYRGSPEGELNEGDWVTLSLTYAQMYAGDGAYAGDGSRVYSYKVKAKELVFPGDSIAEFGYWGEPLHC